MKLLPAVAGGIAGAVVLTLLHETVRRLNTDAPRMDLLGMEAIAKSLDSVDAAVPEEGKLFKITMAGDLLTNSLYYSLAGYGDKEHAIIRGALLGLAAGLGGVYLPGPLGLNPATSGRTLQTKLMTVAWYITGGLTAGGVAALLSKKLD